VRKTAYNDLEIDEIDETSAVDNPAQVGARAAIFKRAIANTGGSPVGSGTVANTQENPNVTKVEDQPALDAVQKQPAAAQAELEIHKSIAGLSDVERALYRGLDQVGQSAFLKLSPADRVEKVRAAGEANPVVYTSPFTGESFRKSDDQRLVSAAKRADKIEQDLATERTLRGDETFSKRADEELKNLPGKKPAKVALLKVVEGIQDSAVRDEVKALIKAGNDSMAKNFTSRGTESGADEGGSAHEKLEVLAKNLRKSNPKLSEVDAYALAGEQNPEIREEAIRQG